MSDESVHHPYWWNSKLDLVMMAVSAITVLLGIGARYGMFTVPFPVYYLWALILPYIAVGVYLDGKTIWRKHNAE